MGETAIPPLKAEFRLGGSDKLRFYYSGASLPESAELVAQLDAKLSAAEAHAEEEARGARAEARRADDAERRLAEALVELEKLRSKS